MAGKIMFAELHMLAGEPQDASGLVGVAASPSLSLFKRRHGQLFTVVEPSHFDAGPLCRELIRTIEDEYFRDSYRSITGSLREALAAANERLRMENARLSPERQLRVGLSCAAVRDNEVYIAQVSPANAFVFHDGAVKKLFSAYSEVPETSSNGFTRASDALGTRLEPQVNFGFSLLEDGDLVVMATGAYWKLIPERYIAEAARHLDPEMAASELYNSLLAHARRPTTSLVVIRVAELPARSSENSGERPEAPGAPVERREPLAGGRPGNGRHEAREVPRLPAAESPGAVPGTQAVRRTGPKAPERPGGGIASGQERRAGRREEPEAERASRPAGRSLWDRIRPKGRTAQAPLYPSGPPLEPVGRPSVRLRDRPMVHRERQRRPGWLGPVLAMLLLAAAFVVAGSYGFKMWTLWQFGDPVALSKEATEKRAQAAAAGDESAARGLLVESLALYGKALRAREDEALRSTTAAIEADIDRIDRTVRVGQTKLLVDLSQVVAEKGDVTRLALDGTGLYLLDEGLDRILKYALTPDGRGLQESAGPTVLAKRGDKLDGAVVGELLGLAWMPAGQLRTTPALFALESGRAIVAHDPKAGLSRIEVGESKRWGFIQAIAGFGGGLYLLDTKQRAVYYYPPTKGGYESEPYTIVDSRARADLSRAVDIALDGSLYLLEGDGSVKRFTREGKALEFDGRLPGGLPKGARSLFASANTRSLYQVDSAGERVVQFSPEGKLQRQFRAGKDLSFQDLRHIFVDEASRRAYLLARKSLVVFDMPATGN